MRSRRSCPRRPKAQSCSSTSVMRIARWNFIMRSSVVILRRSPAASLKTKRNTTTKLKQSSFAMADTDAIVVFMTAANGEEATRLAEMLVGAHLAACVQILPEMESVYRWQGKTDRQSEILLLAKTTRAKFDDLEREVRALHSYDTPEIIAVPVVIGSGPYLHWLRDVNSAS